MDHSLFCEHCAPMIRVLNISPYISDCLIDKPVQITTNHPLSPGYLTILTKLFHLSIFPCLYISLFLCFPIRQISTSASSTVRMCASTAAPTRSARLHANAREDCELRTIINAWVSLPRYPARKQSYPLPSLQRLGETSNSSNRTTGSAFSRFPRMCIFAWLLSCLEGWCGLWSAFRLQLPVEALHKRSIGSVRLHHLFARLQTHGRLR